MAGPQAEGQMQPQASPASRCEDISAPQLPAGKSPLHPGTSFPPTSILAKAAGALGKAGSLIPGPSRDIVQGQKGKRCVRPFAHCALSPCANTAQHFHCQPCEARGGCSRHTA